MRFQLDAETARWLQHGLLRPAAVAAGLDPAVSDKLSELWDSDERVLDLSGSLDDLEFLHGLVAALVRLARSGDDAYLPLYDLAKRIVGVAHTSIVDRLASIYNPPPAVEIKSHGEQAKEIAAQKMKERFGL